ncbi:MAG: hypothetical protein AB2669_03445 [Candidatus Thiodiazotropha endolucinida]|nr:hypothetical protein [Candidatus Thiodiazotropha taylori]MCW4342679.1 hypothetical protein [Candidatus Thiodiazotropha endolucinida]
MPDMIDTHTLKMLIKAGSVQGVHAIDIPGGYALEFDIGMDKATLRTQRVRKEKRKFASLDKVARYLESVGVIQFEVNRGTHVHGSRPL